MSDGMIEVACVGHGDRKKPGELCGSRTFFGIAAKSRIPLVELVSEFFIQHSRPYLQEQMGAATTPAHLLLFHESLAYHLIHGRFDKCCRDRLTSSPQFTIVRNPLLIVFNVSLKLLQCHSQPFRTH